MKESNELFLFENSLSYGEYLNEITDKLFQFNFINFVNNYLKMDYVPKIKEIFGTYKIIILQLENNEYILFANNSNIFHGLYIKDNLKMFAICPLSPRFIAINSKLVLILFFFVTCAYLENNEIKSLQFDYVSAIKEKTVSDKANEIIKELIKKGIKIFTCGGDFSVIVTNDNKMYFEGPNTFCSQSGIQTVEFEYTYLKTPFEEMSEIKQVKCGYFHTVVLLNNGKVFAVGYNLLKQCGQNSADDSQTFLEFKLSIGLQVKEIGCSSRGTYFTTTNTDKVYFVGEVVENLQKEEFGDVTAHCLNLQYSTNLKFNTVVPGGWHYVVYYKNLKKSKSLIYFNNNLQRLTTIKNVFVDIYFYVKQ